MSTTVNYVAAARRHLHDGCLLLGKNRAANAGQLFGFSVECGIKALLIACGVHPGPDGGIPERHQFRTHVPHLSGRVAAFGHLIPDGPRAASYLALLSSLNALRNWSTDHRYWSESAIPMSSVPAWELAAMEVNEMLDQASLDGVI